jgi:pimeloyl-ACP methyl ester carboxylesterase
MITDRIHRVVSADGTAIAGHIVGQGPPLVLIHGALYCGETAFEAMLPHLADHYTCFLPSTRGRGLSDAGHDYSPARLSEDVIAFVDGIGQPVPLFGWSFGGMLALATAASSQAVSTVVAYEPLVVEAIDEEFSGRFSHTVARMYAEVGEGRPAEAARLFMALVCNDDELEANIAMGLPEIAAAGVPADLRAFEKLDPTGPSATDPALLATLTVPILLLQGDLTVPLFDRGNRHVLEHAPDAENRIVPGAGHGGPGLAPEAVARELVRLRRRSHEPA